MAQDSQIKFRLVHQRIYLFQYITAMAYALALLPLGMGAFKIYQNMQPDARQANSDEMRKQGIVERLSTGSNPRIAALSEKQFEKFLKTNSVGKSCEPELREARSKLLGQSDEAPKL